MFTLNSRQFLGLFLSVLRYEIQSDSGMAYVTLAIGKLIEELNKQQPSHFIALSY